MFMVRSLLLFHSLSWQLSNCRDRDNQGRYSLYLYS